MSHARVIEPLRRMGEHPRIEPAAALVLRARTVRGSGAFVAREALKRSGVREYSLRRSGLKALIRHGTPDVVTLGEVFHRPDYALPPDVERHLGARRERLRVLDLGANIGLFGLWVFGELPGARVEAFEPDPANAEVLRRVVEANRLSDRWTVTQAAAGATAGEMRFEAGAFAVSRADAHGSSTVPVVDVLPRLPDVDLLKMDIEGGEWAILTDPRFGELAPPAIVLEYHPHMAPQGPSPRAAVEGVLTSCGYALADIFHRPDGHGMLWAWR